MAWVTRRVRVAGGVVLAAIAVLAGCGRNESAAVPAGGASVTGAPEENLFDAPAQPSGGAADGASLTDGSLPGGGTLGPTELEVARLTSFWAVERFFADGDFVPVVEDPRLAVERLAKAEVDECYEGEGVPSTLPVDGTCATGRAKTNQAYVWGLTRSGRTIWFGTIANTLCQVLGGFLGIEGTPANDYWVCEGLRADFRPPHIYSYDLDSESLTLRDPPPDPPGVVGPATLLRSTIGFRSAGASNGVVFLAGPGFGGINVFAFDGDTGALLGAKNLPEYDDIRTWLEVNGVLYAGVANEDAAPDGSFGSILRWTGTKSSDPALLFAFDVVGRSDNEAANLALHEGRIYTTTWPGGDMPIGLYRSPPIPAGGFTADEATRWEKVWSITDYDPDPISAMTTAGGAVASFGGKLYWGTMHVPFVATQAAVELDEAGAIDLDADGDGELGPSELLATALGTHRTSSLFVLEDGVVKVLFGETFLPIYDAAQKRYTIAFDLAHQNRAENPVPLRGSSGAGNFFNAYTWSMQAYGDALYIGMFDWTQVARVGAEQLLGLPEVPLTAPDQLLAHLGTKLPQEGADLLRLDADGTFTAESLTGLGNDTNYGVRTMLTEGDALFVGTANPMNLSPKGGWELLRLQPPR